MLAWERYRQTLCEGCGEPKDLAWHPDMDGWYEVHHLFTCHSCTARARAISKSGEPVEPKTYPGAPINTRDLKAEPLDPIDFDSPDLKV